jgi:hypothetical protein
MANQKSALLPTYTATLTEDNGTSCNKTRLPVVFFQYERFNSDIEYYIKH